MRTNHDQSRTEAISNVPAVRSQVAAPESRQAAGGLPQSQMQEPVLGCSEEGKAKWIKTKIGWILSSEVDSGPFMCGEESAKEFNAKVQKSLRNAPPKPEEESH
jgi:hypothetical protein